MGRWALPCDADVRDATTFSIASLFSQEFFVLARTFRSACPSVTVWSSLRADILLVALREDSLARGISQ